MFNGYRVSVLQDEKVLDLDRGQLYNVVNVLNATNGKFCFVYFTTTKS